MNHSSTVGDREARRTGAIRVGGEREWNAWAARIVTARFPHGRGRLRMLAMAAGTSACIVVAARPTYAAADPREDCGRWAEQARLTASARDTIQSATITGTVRSGTLGTALPGARVDVPESRASACSDSAGEYRLVGLMIGPVTVRVSRAGYDTLSVLVTVPARGIIRVDITLSASLVVLDSIRVSAAATAGSSKRFPTPIGDADSWRWQGDPAASAASTGEPDLLRTLSADPHLGLRPDWPGSFMDRGGTSDQLLVRVDGLPVWSPVHGGGTLSAISPDAIGSFTVHDGAMPAAYGDRLGGVVDVETPVPPAGGWSGGASLGPDALRATWGRPLTLGDAAGGVEIAVRHSNDDLQALANDAGPMRDHWADGVATVALATGATALRLVMVESGDRAMVGRGSGSSDTAAAAAIHWSTGTVGVVWTQRLGRATTLESHLSSARFGLAVPSASDSIGRRLTDDIGQMELATQLSSPVVTFGAAVDALRVSYRVVDGATAEPGSAIQAGVTTTGPRRPPLAIVGAPTLASAFAEHTWGPADSVWRVTTGVRGLALLGLTARLEPRVDASVRVIPGVVATLGYARTHQAVQSLRNLESPVGAEIGVDFPVAAGKGGVPLARSDVGSAGIVTSLGIAGRLALDGYVRGISGLAVTDPVQRSLFATTGFARASAHITGLGAQLTGTLGHLTWQAGYGVGRTIESAAGMRYFPTSALGQTGSVALGIAVNPLTQVRLAGWVATGQRAGGIDGSPNDRDDDGAATTSASDLSEHGLTTPWLATDQLPAYLRADLQLAHQWQTGPARGRLSAYLTLANIFNHANIAGEMPTSPSGSYHGITLLPRSLLVGVSWAH